jgi:hypothetical protein
MALEEIERERMLGVSEVEWALGRDLTKGNSRARPGMALVDWWRWAARVARRKGTRRGSGAAPVGPCT